MDLHRHYRGALVCALTLMFVGSTPAWADKTLWLVRPLYPGQETLVDRTEKALDKLMPADARQDSVIGQKELAAAFKGRVQNLQKSSAPRSCPPNSCPLSDEVMDSANMAGPCVRRSRPTIPASDRLHASKKR